MQTLRYKKKASFKRVLSLATLNNLEKQIVKTSSVLIKEE